MFEFIMMTISFTVAILLAGVLGLVVFLQPKVMKLYMKMVMKSMKDIDEITEDILKGDE